MAKYILWVIGIGIALSIPAAPRAQNAIAARLSQRSGQFADRIVSYMQSKGYTLFKGPKEVNIVYVEGVNEDGSLNKNQGNHYNDRRIVIEFQNGQPKIVGNWLASINPGIGYLGVNPKGLPHIMFGQYKAWQVGTHVGPSGVLPHEGLLQVAPIQVVRNWSTVRPSNPEIEKGKSYDDKPVMVESGEFGINQHWGYNSPANNIGNSSAGCIIGQDWDDHVKFMSIVKSDPNYQKNPEYVFTSTIISGTELNEKTQ